MSILTTIILGAMQTHSNFAGSAIFKTKNREVASPAFNPFAVIKRIHALKKHKRRLDE